MSNPSLTTAVSNNSNNASSNDDKKTGGIGWAGSLVGINNPNNLGYRYSTPSKRYRLADAAGDGTGDGTEGGNRRDLPKNIQVIFRNRQGEALTKDETLDLPIESTVEDLNALLHSLMSNDDDDDDNRKIPYAFYTKIEKQGVKDDVEVTHSLLDLLQNYASISTEAVLQLTYQPLAVLRVRPVTRCTDTLSGHAEAVLHVQFSPDGRLLASGGGDATVRFWDTHTATPKWTCTLHRDHVLCTAWSPDGHRFVSADKRGVLITWEPFATISRNRRKTENEDDNNKNTDSSTGAAATAANSVRGKKRSLHNSHPPHRLVQAHKKWITSMAWEPMHLVSQVAIQAAGGSATTNNDKSPESESSCCLSCCERLVTASKDGTAKIWNVRTQQALTTLSGHTDSVEAVKWCGAGLIITASRDRTIKVWNPDRGILVRTLQGHGHRVNTLALSTDFCLRTGPFDYTSTLSNHKKRSFASAQEAVDAAKLKYETFMQQQGQERLVSGSDDFTLFLWHPTESKHPIKRLTGHQQAVNHIAFSPDARFFASASFDKKVKLWNGFSGDFLLTLTGHVGAVYQVAWSADSRHLVSASKDSTAKLWQIPEGKRAKDTLPGHADEIYSLDWSPTGSSVGTGSKDRTIKIWKH